MLGLAILLAAAPGAANAAKGGGFEGAWQAIDAIGDQNDEWMWIREFSGIHEVLVFDTECTCCDAQPCMGIGSGRVDGATLHLDSGMLTCYRADGLYYLPELPWQDSYQYVQGKGLLDNSGTMWTPSNDKKPEKVVPWQLP